ncbi:MAG: hypothetical protein WBW32_06885, partial [Luteibacter sp.]
IYLPDPAILGPDARPVFAVKGSTGPIVDPAAPAPVAMAAMVSAPWVIVTYAVRAFSWALSTLRLMYHCWSRLVAPFTVQ